MQDVLDFIFITDLLQTDIRTNRNKDFVELKCSLNAKMKSYESYLICSCYIYHGLVQDHKIQAELVPFTF